MRAHFRHLHSKSFPIIEGTIQSNGFWPLQLLFENLEIHQDSNSQSGSSLGGVGVHSLTLSHISWASLLARTLASPCFGYEPKARVVIMKIYKTLITGSSKIFFVQHLLVENLYLWIYYKKIKTKWYLGIFVTLKFQIKIPNCISLISNHVNIGWYFHCHIFSVT